jgi:hypothetical protein
LKAQELVTDLQELQSKLQVNIQESQECYQQSTNKYQIPPLEFKVGDKAFVTAKFFQTTQPSKKLSEKYLGPFDIINQVGPLSWTLHLLTSMHAVHPVFYVSMLELSTPNSVLNHIQPPPLIIIDEEPEYEISKILSSKLDKQWACNFQNCF